MYQFPVLIGLFLFGTVMLAFGTYLRLRYLRWKAESLTAEGTVVRLETDRPGHQVEASPGKTLFGRKSRGPRRVWPVFSYQDQTGEMRERRSPNAMKRGTVAIGDRVPLFYPGDRPYAARVDDGSELRVSKIAIALAILCVPGLVAALFI